MIDINQLSTQDFNMYYNDTFLHSTKHGYVRCEQINLETQKVYCHTSKGKMVEVEPQNLSVSRHPLGFFESDGQLVFIQRIPSRTVKKSLAQSNTEEIFVQENELRHMRKHISRPSLLVLLNIDRKQGRLSDGIPEGATFSILHHNFALAYKGYTESPVLFYRDTPVGELSNSVIVPYEGYEIVVEKFQLEFGG